MSTTTLGPPVRIDGPYPQPPRFRLVDVATIVPEAEDYWMSGAQVQAYPPDLPHTWNPCTPSESTGTKEEGGLIPAPLFGAFTAYLAETCTSRGIVSEEQFTARALAAFGAVESYAVELEFSQGLSMTANPFLADADADILTSGPTGIRAGMALLEEAIGATGRAGVIHLTPGAATAARSEHLVDSDGTYLRTILGTPVVVGDGYIGAVPDGEDAPDLAESWAFATGPVQIRRSDIFINPPTLAEALDREINQVTYRAERYYLVDWDTALQAAILLDWTA